VLVHFVRVVLAVGSSGVDPLSARLVVGDFAVPLDPRGRGGGVCVVTRGFVSSGSFAGMATP
jgi:hypothetical protein